MKVQTYICDACGKEIEFKSDLVSVVVNTYRKRNHDVGHESFSRSHDYHDACFALPKQVESPTVK